MILFKVAAILVVRLLLALMVIIVEVSEHVVVLHVILAHLDSGDIRPCYNLG